jgi:hypothetical protein
MRRSAFGAFLAAIENRGQGFLKTARLQKPMLDVIGDEVSSFSIGTVRPLQPVSPWRALV